MEIDVLSSTVQSICFVFVARFKKKLVSMRHTYKISFLDVIILCLVSVAELPQLADIYIQIESTNTTSIIISFLRWMQTMPGGKPPSK